MAELSEEKIKKIRDHLFAVAELLGDVPAPPTNGHKARNDMVSERVLLSAISEQPKAFTKHQVVATLALRGLTVNPEAVAQRLYMLAKDGRVSRPYPGHFSLVKPL